MGRGGVRFGFTFSFSLCLFTQKIFFKEKKKGFILMMLVLHQLKYNLYKTKKREKKN